MREIKFKAWDKKNKTMAYSDDGNQGYGWFTDNSGCMLCVRIEERRDIKLNNIMQYTGLKDKNGKEIYEGDIIKFLWEEDSCWGEAGEYKGYIAFNQGVFEIVYIGRDKIRKYPGGGWSENNTEDDIKSFLVWTGEENIEVIGNISENPELCSKE
ncbi:YopX family protein [Hathewaya histolytica]|uniref:Phage protein TIGR01671 n=1 Tax=Hathewaya histolytica TaxID=1498 RepID=A0A4U9RC75_HATHI|nr:YopX family protein [Hathewaya histolytica]VTQ88568.1 phage protein TIGR01671 [Hathewaya histolytica]